MQQEHQACINLCYECAAACDRCAGACLEEQDPAMMKACVRLAIQCAAVCRLTAQLMASGSDYLMQLCRLCTDICKACAQECAGHQYDHCQACAQACGRCAEVCLKRMA